MFLDNGVWVLVSVLYPKREPRRYIQMRVRVGRRKETYASWRRRACASAWRAPSFWSWRTELWTVNGVLFPLRCIEVEGVVGVGVAMSGRVGVRKKTGELRNQARWTSTCVTIRHPLHLFRHPLHLFRHPPTLHHSATMCHNAEQGREAQDSPDAPQDWETIPLPPRYILSHRTSFPSNSPPTPP